MLTTPLLLLALAAPRTGADTIRLAEIQADVWYHRPGIRLIITPGDSIVRLAVTVREPQFFATTTLTLTDAARRDSLPMATLKSDSSSVDARIEPHQHTLWFRIDMPHLREWAAASTPGLSAGKVRSTLDAQGQRRLRAAVARMATTAG